MEHIAGQVLGFLPVLVRILATVMALPLFGGRGVPNQVKIGLSLFVALVLYPALDLSPLPVQSAVGYFALVSKEVAVGLSLGFTVTLVFSAVYLAGQLIDVPMGFGMVNVVEPQSGLQVPIFAQFQYVLAALVFLSVGGHRVVLRALAVSFDLVPLAVTIRDTTVAAVLFELFVKMFYLGVKLSLPVVAGLLLADIALGIVARAVPQINIFVVGFPAKTLLGIPLFILVLPAYIALLAAVLGAQGELGVFLHRVLSSL